MICSYFFKMNILKCYFAINGLPASTGCNLSQVMLFLLHPFAKGGIRIKRILCCLLALALLALTPASLAEEPIAAASLITENTGLDLTPYEGKAIYLNFFTGWCYYCMQEMPDIKTLYETYDPDELAIVLVHVWDGEDESESDRVRAEYGLEELTFYEDEDRSLASYVGLQGYPASMFIDSEGLLRGGYNYYLSLEQMTAVLDAMEVPLRPQEETDV